MSYSTVSDIQTDFKSIVFDNSSLVTAAAVTGFIAEADALINSYVGKKYQIPVTGDVNALALLKLYSRTIVRDRLRGILAVKQGKNTDGNSDVRGAEFTTKDVMLELREIQTSALLLSGATPLEAYGAFFSRNAASNERPVFRKDRRQW